MAFPWLAALKVIPWADVLEAAPVIVKGAKRLFRSSPAETPATQPESRPELQPAEAASATVDAQRLAELDARVRDIGSRLSDLSLEQQQSAALINSLAEQNERVVEAIELIRIRTKLLLVLCVVLAAGLLAAVLWVATR